MLALSWTTAQESGRDADDTGRFLSAAGGAQLRLQLRRETNHVSEIYACLLLYVYGSRQVMYVPDAYMMILLAVEPEHALKLAATSTKFGCDCDSV